MSAYIIADLGGATSIAWVATASSVAIAAVAPFAGAISDLIGRRYVAILADVFIIWGMILVGTAKNINVAIGGSAVTGVGGALAELAGFAGIAEIAPVKHRGTYLGTALLFNLPFTATQAYGSKSLESS